MTEIVPDTKDWTWVLDRPCPECGFDTRRVRPEDVADLLDRVTARWVGVLRGGAVTARPRPDTWSPLEYGCHVRDVFRIYDERLHLMLDKDDPDFPNWDQDATAREDDYGDKDPATVAAEVDEAGTRLAASFRTVGDRWERTGNRSDGARFTVATFARYFVHDPVHHLHDAGADISALPGVGTAAG